MELVQEDYKQLQDYLRTYKQHTDERAALMVRVGEIDSQMAHIRKEFNSIAFCDEAAVVVDGTVFLISGDDFSVNIKIIPGIQLVEAEKPSPNSEQS